VRPKGSFFADKTQWLQRIFNPGLDSSEPLRFAFHTNPNYPWLSPTGKHTQPGRAKGDGGLISNLLSYGSGYIIHLGCLYVTQEFQSQMDATRLYPTHSGPALSELLLDSSKALPGCIGEVYGYEGADHGNHYRTLETKI
jgi:hypothetical protein